MVCSLTESSILLFDEEEEGGLWRIGWSYLPGGQVLIQEVLGGFTLVGRKRVYLPNLWGEGIVKVDFMIIGSGRGDMVSGFF